MGTKHRRRTRTGIRRLIVCLFLLTSGVPAAAVEVAAPENAAGRFAGSESCRECHQDFYRLWSTSLHGRTMQPFSPELAAGLMSPQADPLAVGKESCRMVWDDDGGWMEAGSGGESRKHQVAWVVGGKNVFCFLSRGERGRLQTLPVAFDVASKTWFDATASGVRHPPGGSPAAAAIPMDWTDRMYTFNTSCYGCHVSQVNTCYDQATDTYRTSWVEPGISCESCHGPASEHNRIAARTPKGEKLPEHTVVGWKGRREPAKLNDLCATCHAKLVPLTDAFRPGDRFFDHYDLALLDDPDFYPDGRDLGENYTFTGWLLSPCAAGAALDCNACHTPSGRYRFKGKGNEACTPCHEVRVREATLHTRHKDGSPGNECVACHMPGTVFARMARHDHSMLPPCPSATLRFSSPNACNAAGCHADRTAAWADGQVRQWHTRDYQKRILDRALLIAAARGREWDKLPEMLAYLADATGNQVFKASLIRLLHPCGDERKWAALVRGLRDTSPLVRARAAEALASHRSPDAVEALLEATADGVRLVRLRAAEALSWLHREEVKEEHRSNLFKATAELEASYLSRPDDWSLQYNRGNYLEAQGRLDEALEAYAAASRLEPRVIQPYVNAALAYIRKGDRPAAEASLVRALAQEPGNAEALFNLGLLQAELGRSDDAARSLRGALASDGTLAPAAYNLCLLTAENGPDEALSWCRRAVELAPGDGRYGCALAWVEQRRGDAPGAERTLLETIRKNPSYAQAYLLLGELYEGQGRRTEAAGLYRGALARRDIAGPMRQEIESRLRAAK